MDVDDFVFSEIVVLSLRVFGIFTISFDDTLKLSVRHQPKQAH